MFVDNCICASTAAVVLALTRLFCAVCSAVSPGIALQMWLSKLQNHFLSVYCTYINQGLPFRSYIHRVLRPKPNACLRNECACKLSSNYNLMRYRFQSWCTGTRGDQFTANYLNGHIQGKTLKYILKFNCMIT